MMGPHNRSLNLLLKAAVILAAVVMCGRLSAANYYFHNLGLRDGLSQSTVYAILQDSKGFMWFGTKGGLCRYDGVSIREFRREKQNPFCHNDHHFTANVQSFVTGGSGRMWIGFYCKGLYFSADGMKTVSPYVNAAGDEVFRGDVILKIIAGSHNTYRNETNRYYDTSNSVWTRYWTPWNPDTEYASLGANNGFVGPGHNSQLITDKNGRDWILYHSYFRDKTSGGRYLMLDEVVWEDGCPRLAKYGPSSVYEHPQF